MPNNMFAGAIEVLSNGPQAPVELAAGELQVRSLGLQYGDTNETALSAAQSQSSISGSVVEPHRRPPYSLQYSLGIQREITPSTVFEIGYVGNHAVRTIYSPVDRRFAAANASYPVSESTTVFAELNYALVETNSEIEPFALDVNDDVFISSRGGTGGMDVAGNMLMPQLLIDNLLASTSCHLRFRCNRRCCERRNSNRFRGHRGSWPDRWSKRRR